MYLVCYERVEPVTLFNAYIQCIQGPYYHAELVFVKDHKVDSLFISLWQNKGSPCMLIDRQFKIEDRPIIIHWFKFKHTTFQQETEVRKNAELAVESKKYYINHQRIVATSLPRFLFLFYWCFAFIYFTAKKSETRNAMDAEIEQQEQAVVCIELFAIVLNMSFEDKIPQEGNITDIIVDLQRKGIIEKVPQPLLTIEQDPEDLVVGDRPIQRAKVNCIEDYI
jgi:hypothetical protein